VRNPSATPRHIPLQGIAVNLRLKDEGEYKNFPSFKRRGIVLVSFSMLYILFCIALPDYFTEFNSLG
jgi:hypothetical protein